MSPSRLHTFNIRSDQADLIAWLLGQSKAAPADKAKLVIQQVEIDSPTTVVFTLGPRT